MIDLPNPLEADPPPAAARPPTLITLPPGSVDSHAHVIGAEGWIAGRSYTPCPAPPAAYLRMLDHTGMAHGVLVQVSVHGSNNSLLLDTLRAHRARLRGIAVTGLDTPRATLQAMREAGVVGLRLNTASAGGIGLEHLERYAALCADLGWHLQLLLQPAHLPGLVGRIGALPVPVVLDHMGSVRPGMAAETAALMRLVHEGAWVKLSGIFRLSHAAPPHADTRPLVRALAQAAPARCLWGSDWPHVAFRGPMPVTGDLIDALADAVDDPAACRAILATNPQRLYGFPPNPTPEA